MTSKILCFGLGMVLTLAAAFAQHTFTSREGGFTIIPPKGWKSESGGPYGILAVFHGPIEKNFALNINYVVENLPTSISLNDYTTAALRAVAGSLVNYKLISKRTVSVARTKAIEHVYQFNLSEAGMKLKGKQLIFVRGRKALVFTFTALASNYSKYVSTFDQSMKTLRWRKG